MPGTEHCGGAWGAAWSPPQPAFHSRALLEGWRRRPPPKGEYFTWREGGTTIGRLPPRQQWKGHGAELCKTAGSMRIPTLTVPHNCSRGDYFFDLKYMRNGHEIGSEDVRHVLKFACASCYGALLRQLWLG